MSTQGDYRALSERYHPHITTIPGCTMCRPLAASLKLAESVVAAPVSVMYANLGSLSRCARDNGHEINFGELMLKQRIPGNTFEFETYCIRQTCITPTWVVNMVPLGQQDSFLNLLRELGFNIMSAANVPSAGTGVAVNNGVTPPTSTTPSTSISDRFSSFPSFNSNTNPPGMSVSNPFMTDSSCAPKRGVFANVDGKASEHSINSFANLSFASTSSNPFSTSTTMNPLSRGGTAKTLLKSSTNNPFTAFTPAGNPSTLPKTATSTSIGSPPGSTLYNVASSSSIGTIGSYPSSSSSASGSFSFSMGAAPPASSTNSRTKSGRPLRRIPSRPGSRSSVSGRMAGSKSAPVPTSVSGGSPFAFTFGSNAPVPCPITTATSDTSLSGPQHQPFAFGASAPVSTPFVFSAASSATAGPSTSVSYAPTSAPVTTTATSVSTKLGAPSTPTTNRKQALSHSQTSFPAFTGIDKAAGLDGMETAATTSFPNTPEALHERFAHREASSPTKSGFTSSRSLEMDLSLAGKMVISPTDKPYGLPRERETSPKADVKGKGKAKAEKDEVTSPGLSGLVRCLSVHYSPPERRMDGIEPAHYPPATDQTLENATTMLDFGPPLPLTPETFAPTPTALTMASIVTPAAPVPAVTAYNTVASVFTPSPTTVASASTTTAPASTMPAFPDVVSDTLSTSTPVSSSTCPSQPVSAPVTATSAFSKSAPTKASSLSITDEPSSKKMHKERLMRRRAPDEPDSLAEETASKRTKQMHVKPEDNAQAKWTRTEASRSASYSWVRLASNEQLRFSTPSVANLLGLDLDGSGGGQLVPVKAPYLIDACTCPKPASEGKLPISDPLAILVSKDFIITRTKINHVFLTAFEMLDEPRACMRPWCNKIINESLDNKEPAMVIYWVDMAKEERRIELKDNDEADEERVEELLAVERSLQPVPPKKLFKYHQKEETSAFCCDSDCLNRNPRWLEALDKLSPFAVWANDDRIIGQAILDVLDMAQAMGLREPPPWWTTARHRCSSTKCQYIEPPTDGAQNGSNRKAAKPSTTQKIRIENSDGKGPPKKARKHAPSKEKKSSIFHNKSPSTELESGKQSTSVLASHIARSRPVRNFQTVAESAPAVALTKVSGLSRSNQSLNLKSNIQSALLRWPVDKPLDPRTPAELRVIRREASERLRLLHVLTVDEVKTVLYRTFSLGVQIPGTLTQKRPARRSVVPSFIAQQDEHRRNYLAGVRVRGLAAELARQLQLVENYKPSPDVQIHLPWPVLGSPEDLLPNWMAQKARLRLEHSLRHDTMLHLTALEHDLAQMLSTGSDPESPPALWPLSALQYSEAALELPSCRSDEYLVIAWESHLERNYLAAKIFSARYCEAKASERTYALRR